MKKILLGLGLCLMLSGFNSAHAFGIIYEDTIIPVIATDMKTENVKNLKCGEAQIFNSFGLIETGHAGIQKAAIRAGITQIHHVDSIWRINDEKIYIMFSNSFISCTGYC